MASVIFNRGKFRLASGALDWDGAAAGVIRVALASTAVVTPSADLNFVADFFDSTNNVELTTTNYSRQDLASRTVTEDDTNDRVVFDAADNVWTSLGPATGGPTVRGVLVYERVGADDSTPADDHLICWLDFADTTVNGQNFTVQYAAAGLIAG